MGGIFGGGGGGSYSAPEVKPIPEKQATKSISAGTTQAYSQQKDRQRKNRGLAASIMTSRGALESGNSGNTTLG